MKKYIDLEEYDDSVTVGQLIQKIKAEEISAKQKENEEIENIKSKFENTYLKHIDEDSLFGKNLNVYCLKNYVRSERTTDWDLIYYFEGTKMSFSQRDIHKGDFNPDRCGNSFSAKELEEMTVISKTEYVDYVQHYEQITERLSNIVNQ